MPALGALAAIGSIASAGVGIAGAAGAFNPSSPDFAAMSRDAQQAEIDLMPQKVAASQKFDPQLAAVQSQIQWNDLFGTPAGTRTVSTPVAGFTNSQTGQFVAGNAPPAFAGGGNYTGSTGFRGNGGARVIWTPTTQNQDKTVTDPGTPGELQMAVQALPTINKLSADANTASRTANIADVQNLGPSMLAALKNFDPQSTAVSDQLASQAQEELAAGSRLTPSMLREDQQNIRAAQSARGMGMGPTDVFTEAFGLGQAGQNLLQQRQDFAGNVINQRMNTYGDPFLAIAGQASGRNVSPTQFGAPATTSQTVSQIQPNSQLLAGALNANVAGTNIQNANIGALAGTNWGNVFSSVGKLFGGVGGTGGSLGPGLTFGDSVGG